MKKQWHVQISQFEDDYITADFMFINHTSGTLMFLDGDDEYSASITIAFARGNWQTVTLVKEF